jgi:1-deoxy-D-xylulose-5-phosphate reductoisomerase
MRVPILFCLGYPDRLPFAFEPFDPLKWRSLEFAPFEPERYPAVELAYDAMRLGGDAGAALNAADEVATAAFLAGQIPFPEITRISQRVMSERPVQPIRSLADAIAADKDGRLRATAMLHSTNTTSADDKQHD